MNDEARLFRQYQTVIDREANALLRSGAFWATWLGVLAVVSTLLSVSFGMLTEWRGPLFGSLPVLFVSLFVFLLARGNRIRGPWQDVVAYLILFTPLPGFLYSLVFSPSGAATVLNAPPSIALFFFIVLTGFFFRPRIPVLAGFLAAALYMTFYVLGRPVLEQFNHPDKTLIENTLSFPIYFARALMMGLTGLAVGVLTRNARRLVTKILEEERRRLSLDRLFGQYVSPEVKERLLRQTADIAGEIKPVAVLFADIRSFSALSEGQPPHALVAQLNEHLEAMVGAVSAQGGVVDKFIGDAVMATFGGVLPLERPCDQALAAARAMREALEGLNRRFAERGWPPLSIGVGIHFGEALVGSIGSVNRKDFTVIGDTVNISSRVESLTKDFPYDILVTGEVGANLTEETRRQGADLGEHPIRGRQGGVRLLGFAPRS